MRVANIIEEGKLGGPQVRIALVAASLKDDVATTVIMPEDNSVPFRKRCDELQVSYKVLALSRITKEWRVALRYVVFSFYEIIRLAFLLRRGEFDLVHVSGGSWQYKGVIAGKLARKKVLWHLNDTDMPRFIRFLFKIISPLADGFIFASERSKIYYRTLVVKGRHEYVIPAPVDTLSFDPAKVYPGEEGFISKWQGKIVIGTVANVNPVKGLDIFIRAAAILNEHVKNIAFVVVGQVYKNQQRYFDSLLQLCDDLAIDNFDFVGSRSDLRPLLKRFDVYVCSSRAESSPISVWEAMAMGKAIVSADVGDVALYVRDGYNGYIVGVEDQKALAAKVETLVGDENVRMKFGGRARETSLRELDIKFCAHRHKAAYVSLSEEGITLF